VASSSPRGTSGVAGEGGSVDGGDTAQVISPLDAVGGWRCKYCTETPNAFGHANPTKGFFSTRKDNFRNHIKRIHSALKRDSESMDDFFRRYIHFFFNKFSIWMIPGMSLLRTSVYIFFDFFWKLLPVGPVAVMVALCGSAGVIIASGPTVDHS